MSPLLSSISEHILIGIAFHSEYSSWLGVEIIIFLYEDEVRYGEKVGKLWLEKEIFIEMVWKYNLLSIKLEL